jgi:hypothetical protein
MSEIQPRRNVGFTGMHVQDLPVPWKSTAAAVTGAVELRAQVAVPCAVTPVL